MTAPEPLKKDILEFISKHIHSVEQIEILAILHREPNREWSVHALDDVIRSSEESLRMRLQDLCRRGFITCSPAPNEVYRFGPSSADLRLSIDALVAAYKNHRIRVIEAIFTKPMTEIRCFSEAFRFRGKKGEGEDG